MKTLNVDELQSEIFAKHGAFFAFSTKQFNEQKVEGVEYENLIGGLVAPKGVSADLFADLEKIQQTKIDFDLANNSKRDLIWDALANYECQITGDISDAVASLAEYGITRDEVKAEWKAYYENCLENDYF